MAYNHVQELRDFLNNLYEDYNETPVGKFYRRPGNQQMAIKIRTNPFYNIFEPKCIDCMKPNSNFVMFHNHTNALVNPIDHDVITKLCNESLKTNPY